MEFKLQAKRLQLMSTNSSNAEFVACLEPKHLLIKHGRQSEAFPYKKVKCLLLNGSSEFIVQSDGLKITMNRHFCFEERLNAAMNGTSVNETQQQRPRNETNKIPVMRSVTRPQSLVLKEMIKVETPSRNKIVSSSATSLAQRHATSPAPDKSPHKSPTKSLKTQPQHTSAGLNSNSIARAFRPAATDSTVSVPNTASNLLSTRSTLSENPSNDSGWLDDENLDLSKSHAPPIVRVYSQKPNNALHFLQRQSPDLARKNLFGNNSTSGSAQKVADPGHSIREKSSDASPYNRLYSTSSALGTAASKLGKLDLIAHSPKSQNIASTPDSAWLTEAEEGGGGVKGTTSESTLPSRSAFRPASSFFDSFRTVHNSSSTGSSSSSGIGTVAGNKRMPGGIRNLGNSCYIGSILQALFSMEGLHQVLLSPFWTTLLEHQRQREGQSEQKSVLAGARSLPIAAIPSTASPTADDAKLDAVLTDNNDGAVSVIDVYSLDASPAVEVSILEKYQTHSVLTELRKLFKEKSELQSRGGADGAKTSAPIPAATILDVTRLKRAMVHHTRKFAGYSQQDAQEFLSDLLDALQCEMQDRFAAFAAFFAGTSGDAAVPPLTEDGANKIVPSFDTPGPSSFSSSSFLSASDGDAVVGVKRSWKDAEALNHATVKKKRSDDFTDSEISALDGASVDVYCIPSTQDYSAVLETPCAQNKKPHNSIHSGPLVIAPCAELMQSTLRVDIQCQQCGHARNAIHEQYQHFPLDLTSRDATSGTGAADPWALKKLLGDFFAQDTRDLKCEHCSGTGIEPNGTAAIHTSIAELPPVLVLQLKRFEYDMHQQKMTKVCAEVDFPSTLDLSPFCAATASTFSGAEKGGGKNGVWDFSVTALLRDPSAFTALCEKIATASRCAGADNVPTSALYELTGVVRHIGRTEGAGHYICDVKLSADERNTLDATGAKEWRRYDDSLVMAIDQNSVMQERDTPYLFFYTRR